MKKKFLFITHEYSGVNGSTLSLYNLIDGIQKNEDIECVVLCPRQGPATSFLKGKKIKTITWVYCTCIKSRTNKTMLLDFIRNCVNRVAAFALLIYLSVSRYDLVLSNSVAVDIGANATRWLKKEHLYYVREFVEEDINCEFINKKQFKKNIEYSKYVIYISKAIENKYENLYHTKKTLTIHDGIKVNDYYIKDHKLFESSKINIIQVGAVTEGKGVWNTLCSAKIMLDNGCTNFNISFIGSVNDEMYDKINKFIRLHNLEDYVALKGYCSDIKQIMAKADVLIMNSELEGLGRVTIEGMLAGCLVLGRSTGGTLELISDAESGYLFKDNQDLARILIDIAKSEDKDVYMKIASRGQEKILKEFDHIRMAKKFLEFLDM